MEEMKQTTVVMTAEEKAEFEAFQREKAKKAAEEKAKNDREMYKQMVDEEIACLLYTSPSPRDCS